MKGNLRLSAFFILFLALLIPKLHAETDLSTLVDPNKTISMDLQDANLKDVLKIFSIQSGLNFIATDAVKDRKVTLYLDNVPIKETMDKLFKANKLICEYDEEANIFLVAYSDDTLTPEMLTKVFQLKYRSVAAANLEKEKVNLFAGASAQGQPAAEVGGANIIDAVKQMLSKDGKISEDASTNSLIVTDLASRFPAIEAVISGLDQLQPQVMLEVEVLDVSKNVIDKLGFHLGDISESPNPLSIILRDHGETKGFVGNLALRGATSLSAGSMVIGDHYASLLDFLSQQADTRYLARPRVLTLNNETAEIAITKDEVMSMKTSRTTDSSGNTSIDITYDRATSMTLTPEGIGIFLRVTPHINLDTGEITMVVNPKTSSATDSVTVSAGSTTSFYRDPEVRSTKSIVKVKDGETIVLGGMIHQEKQETRQKIPLLSDIPFLGALFRNKAVSKNLERELLVFITPRITKDSYIKASNKASSIASGYLSAQTPLTRSDRRQEVSDLLNTFEREKNTNGQRKILQAGGTIN